MAYGMLFMNILQNTKIVANNLRYNDLTYFEYPHALALALASTYSFLSNKPLFPMHLRALAIAISVSDGWRIG